MNKIVFLLLLLPLFCNAQSEKEETNKPSDGKLVMVHAGKTESIPPVKKDDKKNLKNDTKYTGAVLFKIGANDINCDSAIVFENDGVMEAYNVTLTNPEYFTMKGGTLSYNKEAKRGSLLNNIKVTALNGDLVGTSESVDVDFSHDAYRIGRGA